MLPVHTSHSNTVAQIETSLPLHIYEVPIVATEAPIFTSAKVPACLSSNYVPRKPSTVSTNYIPPRVDIDGRDSNLAMISENHI